MNRSPSATGTAESLTYPLLGALVMPSKLSSRRWRPGLAVFEGNAERRQRQEHPLVGAVGQATHIVGELEVHRLIGPDRVPPRC